MKRKIVYLILLAIYIPICAFGQAHTVSEILDIIKHQEKHPHYTLVAAHRGYWANYPENSSEAFNSAISLGVDIVEMDVRLTNDDVMVVFHDACLDRVTTGNGRLRDANWADVQKLNLRLSYGVPTSYKMLSLDEALTLLKDKAVVSIDIKETGSLFNTVLLRVINMLKGKNMLWQSIIKGKMPLAELEELLHREDVTLDDFIYTPIAFSNTPDLDNYINSYVNTHKIYAFELVYKQTADPICKYVQLLQNNHIWVGQYSFWPETADGVFAEKNPLTDTDPVTRDYKFEDKNPNNFLDDGRGDWDWLMSLGANYIITDRSELMIEYLILRGLRSTSTY